MSTSKSQKSKRYYEPKEKFIERMKLLLPETKDFENYLNILKEEPRRSIRCNTLKISPQKLKERLEKNYDWIISQPLSSNPEIMVIEKKSNLLPGQLGRSLEHLLGYYYIQELASMFPPLVLNPKPKEMVLDLCSSPGSKTTQMSARMENTGTIIANEVSMGRIVILSSNLGRCGCSNTIITKKDGTLLCKHLLDKKIKFDKILVDAPCSGEGTIRSTPATNIMWNINTVKKLSNLQKKLLTSALRILKLKGELVYSTCTHSPEENEEVLDEILNSEEFKGKIKMEKINLPKELKPRQGITKWKEKEYFEDVKLSCRFYPQDNDTEGFFISKLKRMKE